MKTLLLILNLTIFTTILNAQLVRWTGTTNTDWGTVTNWNTNSLPLDGDSVIIPITLNSPILDADRAVGNVLIQFGAILDFGSKTLTLKEDFINNGTIITTASTIIFSGAVTQKIEGNHVFHNVQINNSNGVYNNSGMISVTGVLSLQLGIFETNDSLILISDSLGDASIGEILTGSDIIGEVDVQRYVYATGANWRFLSAPIQLASFNDWNDDIITTGIVGSDYPNWPSASNPWASIMSYDESIVGPQDSGLIAPSSMLSSISDGQGFRVYAGNPTTSNSPFTIDVKGEIIKGPVDLPVTYTNSGDVDADGWNMVGNPYPSTIDWDDGDWIKTSIDDAVYIYDPENLQYATYVSGVPNNGGSQYIASSQGFWVKASALNPVLSINEGAKSASEVAFFKSGPVPFSLTVIMGQYTDQASLSVNPYATLGYDSQYDAFKIYSGSTDVPSISIISDDNQELSINSFASSDSIVIPIKVTAHFSGNAQLFFNDIVGLSDYSCVFLEDKETGTVIDLNAITSYSFYLNHTNDSIRFLLHIGNVTSSFFSADTVFISQNNGAFIPTNNSINATQHFWDFGDNSISTLTNPTHYFTSAGNYDVTLTSTNIFGCSEVGIRTVEVIGTTVSVDKFSSVSFKVYPNPIKLGGDLTFEFQEPGKYLIQLYDCLGRSVLMTEIENNKTIISNKFQSGIYSVRILNEANQEVHRTKLIVTD
jgi:hypothetical protein